MSQLAEGQKPPRPSIKRVHIRGPIIKSIFLDYDDEVLITLWLWNEKARRTDEYVIHTDKSGLSCAVRHIKKTFKTAEGRHFTQIAPFTEEW